MMQTDYSTTYPLACRCRRSGEDRRQPQLQIGRLVVYDDGASALIHGPDRRRKADRRAGNDQ